MTIEEFKSDPAKCEWLKRVMNSNTMKQAITAVFKSMEAEEALMVRNNPNAGPNMEVRLTNQRVGHASFLASLETMCEPTQEAKPPPEETFGAENTVSRTATNGWPDFNEQ